MERSQRDQLIWEKWGDKAIGEVEVLGSIEQYEEKYGSKFAHEEKNCIRLLNSSDETNFELGMALYESQGFRVEVLECYKAMITYPGIVWYVKNTPPITFEYRQFTFDEFMDAFNKVMKEGKEKSIWKFYGRAIYGK